MKKRTRAYRFEALHHNRDSVLSLLPLNMMLVQAQKELPARLALQSEDVREELALQLMVNVKRQFKSSCPAHWIGASLHLGLEEMVNPDV